MKKLLLALLTVAASVPLLATSSQRDMPAEVMINGVEFIRIPGGWFWYPVVTRDARNNYEFAGTKEIKTWVDTYYIAKYEARANDFVRFMNTAKPRFGDQYLSRPDGRKEGSGAREGCSVRADTTGSLILVKPEDDLPVTHMSWELANEFAAALGFRLPTEAEWIRAFRGDDKRIYPWGDDYPDDTFAGFQEGATACNVQPVTAFPKGRSPYGVYNMAGNVFEYVADWDNANYLNSLKDGVRNPRATEPFLPPGREEARKRLRGGRWASSTSEISIFGNIDTYAPNDGFNCFGVRFAIDEAVMQGHLSTGTATPIPAGTVTINK